MDNGDEQPVPPGGHPVAPAAFQPADNWSPDITAAATSIYDQVFAQVHENLIQAFGAEVQRLKDSNTEIAAAYSAVSADYSALEQRIDSVMALAARSSGSGRGPRPAAPEKCDGGTQSSAEEFATAIGNAVQFETFANDATKILWSQGFLTGTAAMWSSNITHSQSFAPARYDFDLWIAGFRAMFCSRDRAADARKALHSLSMGNRSISAYCNEAKAIILDLAPGDRGSDLVLDRFKAGLSVVAATRLLNMQPKYTTVDEALGYLLANEQDFIELDRRLAASHRAAPPAHPFVSQPVAAPKVPFQFSRAPAPGPTPHSFQRPPPARDPMAMDLDAARQRSASANTRCRDCSEFGHATCGYTKARARQAWASSAASSSNSPSSSSSWATTSASVSASGSSAPPSPASTTQSDFVGANLV
ncbi:hypothetical protein FIBSPDRAFT_943720 [Athelia psychrophila]|uniref:Retrotransposon gag domain-containing protein n=1 Tax=Athelia psychrophila TaxID=1759441 RepID=A0A166W3E9_9AGAM|nr:hypothetical protein FIBSPDRAFT_943720 [Fibularhizoctonia sp. CBS 109695]